MSVQSLPSIAMFGSSLLSAYWNGAATYYRGIIRALHAHGFAVTFYEPDAYDRQAHRDIAEPQWARVVVYPATLQGVQAALEQARGCDILIKASGVGVFDEFLQAQLPALARPGQLTIFWDVDAPATLERLQACADDPFHSQLRHYDLVLTYGGGPAVVSEYERLGAQRCVPIYNALDPLTHFPAAAERRFTGDVAFLGNRLPDREARVEEFFLAPARRLPALRFVLGGSGWDQHLVLSSNVRYVGHVYTHEHNAFNCSNRAVININRGSMARTGWSPPTRVFEAAGAAACLVCDAWPGIEEFLDPGREVLCVQCGEELSALLPCLSRKQARRIGRAARRRILGQHTYEHRATQLREVLVGPARRALRAARLAEGDGVTIP